MKSPKAKDKSKITGKVKASEKIKINTASKSPISHNEIKEKANEIYLQRIERGESGTAENDWIEAEKFLLESED